MKNNEIKENIVYLCIWVLLFLSAVISVYIRVANDSSLSFRWDEVFMMWRVFIPFLMAFLIHNYVIAPLLVYRKKGWLYLALTLVVIFVFQLYTCQQKPDMEGPPDHIGRMKMDERRPADLPPLPMGKPLNENKPHNADHRPGPPPFDQNRVMPEHEPGGELGAPPFFIGQKNLLSLIVLVLMLGMNLGVKHFFKSARDAKILEELERRNLEKQLEYLKYQINPHFFMNTLNNIHALVDINPEEAKTTILELSKMMRYVLYEGAKSRVPLRRDIDFLSHYIALMRLRYTDKVKISVEFPSDIPERMIPPMLFITFVENAFKHGVSYRKESFIDITMSISGERLLFTCRNSKAEQVHDAQSGVGLSNTRQRLRLIFGSDYMLDIKDNFDIYEVKLEIPVEQEDK